MITITLPRAVVEQALEALESVYGDSCDALHALRAALAQQAEPYAAQSAYWAASDRMGVDPVTGNVSIGAQQAEPAQEPDYWQEEARRYAGNADYWRKRYEALAEPVDTDCHTQGICQRSGYGIPKP